MAILTLSFLIMPVTAAIILLPSALMLAVLTSKYTCSADAAGVTDEWRAAVAGDQTKWIHRESPWRIFL
jgi:hypothetical protein